MHDGQMWENPKFARLPMLQRLLFCALIDTVDDQGRMLADPIFVRSKCLPFDDISGDEMGKALRGLADNGSIILYEADEKPLLQVVNWWRYQAPQYASPSYLPPPNGWKDRIHYRSSTSILSYNWTLRDGNKTPDSCDAHGNPLPSNTAKASPSPTPPNTPNATPVESPVASPEPIVYGQGQGHDDVYGQGQGHGDALARDELPPDPPSGDPEHATPTPFKASEQEFGEIFTAWENARGGTVNATESELLSALVDEFGPSRVREGITTAVKYNKFDRVTIGYLEKIVKNPMHYGTRGAPGNGNGRTREGSFIREARAAGVVKQ